MPSYLNIFILTRCILSLRLAAYPIFKQLKCFFDFSIVQNNVYICTYRSANQLQNIIFTSYLNKKKKTRTFFIQSIIPVLNGIYNNINKCIITNKYHIL